MTSSTTARTAGLLAFLLASWLVLAAAPAASGDEIPAAEGGEVVRHKLRELLGLENSLPDEARFQLSVPHFRHRDRPDVLIPETDLRKHKKKHKSKHKHHKE